MSNLSSTTANIDIQHPEYWTLQLAFGSSEVQYTLHDIDEENSLITGTLPLDLSCGSYLKAAENAIYDNPVLLNDYKKVRIMVESQHFMILRKMPSRQCFPTWKAISPSVRFHAAVCILPTKCRRDCSDSCSAPSICRLWCTTSIH